MSDAAKSEQAVATAKTGAGKPAGNGLPGAGAGTGRATPFNGGGLPGPAGGGLPGGPGGAGPNIMDDDEEFSEDFSDVTAGLVPEGTYVLLCTDLEKTDSKNGKPQYEWDFKIAGGFSPAAMTEKGRGLKEWTSLAPNARWKIVEHLEALGIRASGQIVKFKRSDIVGRAAIGEVYHDEYNGRTNAKIKRLNQITPEGLKIAEAYRKELAATPDL